MAKKTRAKPLRCPACGKVLEYRCDRSLWYLNCEHCWFRSPGHYVKLAARRILLPFLSRLDRDRAIAEAAVELGLAKKAHHELFEDQIQHEHDGWIEARSETRRRVDEAERTFWKLVDTEEDAK